MLNSGLSCGLRVAGLYVAFFGWMRYYINSTSPDMMCFLTAEYRIKKILPSSNVISSPLQLERSSSGWILWKCDVVVYRRSYHPTKDGFVHIRFLNHLFVPGIIEILKVGRKRIRKSMSV
jgi:hypothetical protein